MTKATPGRLLGGAANVILRQFSTNPRFSCHAGSTLSSTAPLPPPAVSLWSVTTTPRLYRSPLSLPLSRRLRSSYTPGSSPATYGISMERPLQVLLAGVVSFACPSVVTISHLERINKSGPLARLRRRVMPS